MGLIDSARSIFGRRAAPAASTSTAVAVREPSWAPKADAASDGTTYRAYPSAPHRRSVGHTGTVINSGRIYYEETNKDLEREKGYGQLGRPGIYDKMRRTNVRIRQSLVLLKYPLLKAQWTIEPADDSDLEREIADFVASNLFEDLPWFHINRLSMLRYDYGFMLFEPLSDTVPVNRARFPNLPHSKGPGRPGADELVDAVRFTAFESRLPRTVRRWAPDPQHAERLAGVYQWVPADDVTRAQDGQNATLERFIPATNLLRFTHEQEGSNYEGFSVLRPAYADYRDLDHLRRIDVVRHERQNCGIPVIEAPENPDDTELADMEATLEALGSYEQAFLLLPYGYKFRFDTTGEGEGTKVGAAIAARERSILDNVLAGFMTLGNGDTGSYAMANTQEGRQSDYIDVGVLETEDAWNKGADGWSPIKWLVDQNYGRRAVYPKLKAKNVRGREAVMRALADLAKAGLITTTPQIQEFCLRFLDVNIPAVSGDEGDDQRGAGAKDATETAAPSEIAARDAAKAEPATTPAAPTTTPTPAEAPAP